VLKKKGRLVMNVATNWLPKSPKKTTHPLRERKNSGLRGETAAILRNKKSGGKRR